MTPYTFASRRIKLYNDRILPEDARRQEKTAREILKRFQRLPGVILADEVGMGKTFVALAVTVSVWLNKRTYPVVVMVPSSLKNKWPKEFEVFKEKCLTPWARERLTCATVESGVEFLKLLDDRPKDRKSIIFLTHSALNRSLTDIWAKLALIQHAFSRRKSLSKVRKAFPRFAASLLYGKWVENRTKSSRIWDRLLKERPERWHALLVKHGVFDGDEDDPVPKALIRALSKVNLECLVEALRAMPLRKSDHIEERLRHARSSLSDAVANLWRAWLGQIRFRSPLLVLDEAHHLKNPWTQLASLFASKEDEEETSSLLNQKGPLFGAFGRMLFLTATPFQLGHYELLNVLDRFDSIAWDRDTAPRMDREQFRQQKETLQEALNAAQAATTRLDRVWGRLRTEDLHDGEGQPLTPEEWWAHVQKKSGGRASEVVRRYSEARNAMKKAEEKLRPWMIRHLKPRFLPDSDQLRRQVLNGATILNEQEPGSDLGIEIHGESLLPFLLAVRAAARTSITDDGERKKVRALFAEGLCSSYEAYEETRKPVSEVLDEDTTGSEDQGDLGSVSWYLSHLERALPAKSPRARRQHPKVQATVQKTVDLWRASEKVLIFCHYRATGRALRRHICDMLDETVLEMGKRSLRTDDPAAVRRELERIGERFFDPDSSYRQVVDPELFALVDRFPALSDEHRQTTVEVIRRFLRTESFLVRFFPLNVCDPQRAIYQAFDRTDGSGITLRKKIELFCEFLVKRCIEDEREEYLTVLKNFRTGASRERGSVFAEDEIQGENPDRLLPNVRLVNGETTRETRRRLLLAFNTPFFPDILIASSVMAEGVDLHLDCRHVIHHDLCWNPSTLEQRTGRVDRIGAKAERAGAPIHVYLPYIAETQDEKMFRVVKDRERWFQVVMGEKYQVDEINTERMAGRVPFPETAARELSFKLEVR